METKRIGLAMSAILICASALAAQDGADALARGAAFFSSGSSHKVTAELTVRLGKESKKRELELNISQSEGTERLLAKVTSPAFLREMKVLQKSSGDVRDTWIKTSQGVRRLGQGSKAEALFQSDFLTTDFLIQAQGWTLSAQDGKDGMRALERPGQKGEDFARQRLYLRSADLLVARREFLDASGAVVRVLDTLGWVDEGGFARPTTIELRKSAKPDSYSVLEIRSVESGVKLSEGLFAPGNL
jgi:hypothetical protein